MGTAVPIALTTWPSSMAAANMNYWLEQIKLLLDQKLDTSLHGLVWQMAVRLD